MARFAALLLAALAASSWKLDENPSCWTDGYTHELCCGQSPLAGCFPGEMAPHTRDRCCQSPCGQALRSRIQQISRSRCPRRKLSNTTLVTGLWNLHREEWPSHDRYQEGEGHSFKKYFDWMSHLLQKPQALIVFAEEETLRYAASVRQAHGLKHLSCLVEVPQEALPQMRWEDGYEKAHAENRRKLPEDLRPEVIQPKYTLVVNSKPELLACAAHWNPFRSQRFAWVDAGAARESKIDYGFPGGSRPIVLPSCSPWSLCVGRRMWIIFDFRDKLKRLEHGTTYDSSVLLGGREGVLLYALWFQWAIERYLKEKVMDDEQSIIAEIWWTGSFKIEGVYGMSWTEVLAQMLMADAPAGTGGSLESVLYAGSLGHWFGDHPRLIWRNTGKSWVPTADLELRETKIVNQLSDEDLERIVYGYVCANQQIPRLVTTASRSELGGTRKYSGGTDDRVQTAAAFVTLLRELGEDQQEVASVRDGLAHYMECFEDVPLCADPVSTWSPGRVAVFFLGTQVEFWRTRRSQKSQIVGDMEDVASVEKASLSSHWTCGASSNPCQCDLSSSILRNVTHDGESYPIGLWVNDWDAAYVTSGVVHILMEELLGYNVIETGPGPGTLNAFYALMGCARPLNLSDAGCGSGVTYNHINVEQWSEDYAKEWSEIQAKYPSRAPLDLGSMGYDGAISAYFPRSVLAESHFQDGNVLEHYRGWNASWSRNEKYFDTLDSIDRSQMHPCNETRFMSPQPNEDYLRVTGDSEGLRALANGDLVSYCPDGYFWLPPACRADPARCIPYLTGALGWWGVDDMMQKVTAFHMPIAIGVARNWAEMPLHVQSTFYWWVPDATFLDLDPVGITFPPYDFNAYMRGDKRTAAASSAITKLVSQDLSTLAPNVEEFIRGLRFNMNDVMDMMRDKKATGDSHIDVACRWLQSNPQSWASWLPDKTKCFPGFGLYDTDRMEFALRSPAIHASWVSIRTAPAVKAAFGATLASTRIEEAGFINVESGIDNLSCVECGEGLDCPALASRESLLSGASALGEQFVPKLLENFYSQAEDPLAVFRCMGDLRCPGGRPGSCAGGLQGTACTYCQEGKTWDDEKGCTECSPLQMLGWIAGVAMVCIGLIVAYYALTSQNTAKASVLFTTACAFGMTITALQSVGIIGMMTVALPEGIAGIYAFLQVFLLDIDSLGFSCLAGNIVPLRYIASASFFPAIVLYLLICRKLSGLLPSKWRWEGSKTWSTVGAMLQVGFSTMSTIALAPMTCFSHPNGMHSVLKYPAIQCGTMDHTFMVVAGVLLLLFGVLGFLSICTYAVCVVPKWSSGGEHGKVKAFRFLLGRFRLDSWWFGVLLLARGPLMSLPIAMATDYPPVQVVSVMLVFLIFLIIEVRSWPWKVPLLNVLDGFIGLCIILLVVSNALQVDAVEGIMQQFANTFSSCVMGLLGFSMLLLLIMTAAALFYQTALGGQQELCMFNLQTLPSSVLVSSSLHTTASQLVQMDGLELQQILNSLAIYDINLLLNSMSLLATEVTPSSDSAFHFKRRIRSSSFAAPNARVAPPVVPESKASQAEADVPSRSVRLTQAPVMHAYI
eukprot:s2250_g6.t3